MGQRIYNPGEKAPRSGQYLIIGVRGGDTGIQRTVARGAPFPPTPKPGQGFIFFSTTRD